MLIQMRSEPYTAFVSRCKNPACSGHPNKFPSHKYNYPIIDVEISRVVRGVLQRTPFFLDPEAHPRRHRGYYQTRLRPIDTSPPGRICLSGKLPNRTRYPTLLESLFHHSDIIGPLSFFLFFFSIQSLFVRALTQKKTPDADFSRWDRSGAP